MGGNSEKNCNWKLNLKIKKLSEFRIFGAGGGEE